MDTNSYFYCSTKCVRPHRDDPQNEAQPPLKKRCTEKSFYLTSLPTEVLTKIINQHLKCNSLSSLFFVSKRLQEIITGVPRFPFLVLEGHILNKLKVIKPHEKKIVKRIELLLAKFQMKFCSFKQGFIDDIAKLVTYNDLNKDLNNDLEKNTLYFAAKRVVLKGGALPLKIQSESQIRGKIHFSLSSSKFLEFPFSSFARFSEEMTKNSKLFKFCIRKNPKLSFSIIKEKLEDGFLKMHLSALDLSLLKILFEQNWDEAFQLIEKITETADTTISRRVAKKLEMKFFILLFLENGFTSIDENKANEYLNKLLSKICLEEIFLFELEKFTDSYTNLSFLKKIIHFLLSLEKNRALEIGKSFLVQDDCKIKYLISFIIFTYHNKYREHDITLTNWKKISELENLKFDKNISKMCKDIFWFVVKQHEKTEENFKNFAKLIENYYNIELTGEDIEGNVTFGLDGFLSCLIPLVDQENLIFWLENSQLKENILVDSFLFLIKDPFFKERESVLASIKNQIPQNMTYQEGFVQINFFSLSLMGSFCITSALECIFGSSFEGDWPKGFDLLTEDDGFKALLLLVNLLGDSNFQIQPENRSKIADALLAFLTDERLKKYLNLIYFPIEGEDAIKKLIKAPIFEILLRSGLLNHGESLLLRIENYLLTLSKKEILADMEKDEAEAILQTLSKNERKAAELKLSQGKNAEILPAEFDLFFEQLKWIEAFRKEKLKIGL